MTLKIILFYFSKIGYNGSMKKHQTKRFVVLAILIILSVFVLLNESKKTPHELASIFYSESEKKENAIVSQKNQVCLENQCFDVELAMTAQERAIGLMYKEHLDLDKGMLFVFSNSARHSFWMKNTLIPLDIIWINKNQEVVYISKNTQPCKSISCPVIRSDQEALYVLEINAGLINQIGLSTGDKVFLNIN